MPSTTGESKTVSSAPGTPARPQPAPSSMSLEMMSHAAARRRFAACPETPANANGKPGTAPGTHSKSASRRGGCDLTLPVTSRCCSAHPLQSIGSVISRHCKSNSHGTDLHEEHLEDRCVITRHVRGTRRRWSGARGTSAGRDPIHGHGSDRVPRRRGSDRGSRRRGSGRASRNRGSDLAPGRRSGPLSTGSTLPSRRDRLARRALPQPNASMVPNLRAATAAAGRALSPRRDAPRLALVAPGSGDALAGSRCSQRTTRASGLAACGEVRVCLARCRLRPSRRLPAGRLDERW